MQNIPDKELDKLFQDRFEDAEVEPSMDLWPDIEAKLDKRPRHKFPVYGLVAIAASAILTVGLIFKSSFPDKQHQSVAVATKPNPGIARIQGPAYVANANITQRAATITTKSKGTVKSQQVMQPILPNIHLLNKGLASVPTSVVKIEDGLVADEQLVFAHADNEPEINTENSVSEADLRKEQRRGIQNAGDLINYVVEKVDKREDKLIEFSTDDDESSLVGLNIGMLRINHKRHK